MNLRIIRKLISMLLLLAVLSVSVNTSALLTAEAAGAQRTFYVDSAGGSDSNTGNSPSQAWKTLGKVNSTVFVPGDTILFKTNSINVGQLYPKGSGAAGEPIIIDQYGTGNRPVIMTDGTVENIVYFYNQSYWEINNLEISGNNDSDTQRGIYMLSEDIGIVNHVYIRNCYIHDIKGDLNNKLCGGILLKVSGTAVPTWYNDIIIENNTVRNVDRTGITTDAWLSWEDRNITNPNQPYAWHPTTNVRFTGNFVDDIGGDGIVLKNAQDGLVNHNVAKNCNARSDSVAANVAIWVYQCDAAVVEFNEAYNTRITHDGEGFDSDAMCTDSVFQYNYSHDNEGGFMNICTPGKDAFPNCFNIGTIVRYNISQNDSGLIIALNGPITNAHIYNNTFFIPPNYDTDIIRAWKWGGELGNGIKFENNIVYNLGTGGYDLGGLGGSSFGGVKNLTFSHNLLYGSRPWNEPSDSNKVTKDPNFVSPGTGTTGIGSLSGYKLGKDSPAIGKGKVIANNGGRDYFGYGVSSSAAPNIGAYNGPPVSSRTLPPGWAFTGAGGGEAFITANGYNNTDGLSVCVPDAAAEGWGFVTYHIGALNAASTYTLTMKMNTHGINIENWDDNAAGLFVGFVDGLWSTSFIGNKVAIPKDTYGEWQTITVNNISGAGLASSGLLLKLHTALYAGSYMLVDDIVLTENGAGTNLIPQFSSDFNVTGEVVNTAPEDSGYPLASAAGWSFSGGSGGQAFITTDGYNGTEGLAIYVPDLAVGGWGMATYSMGALKATSTYTLTLKINTHDVNPDNWDNNAAGLFVGFVDSLWNTTFISSKAVIPKDTYGLWQTITINNISGSGLASNELLLKINSALHEGSYVVVDDIVLTENGGTTNLIPAFSANFNVTSLSSSHYMIDSDRTITNIAPGTSYSSFLSKVEKADGFTCLVESGGTEVTSGNIGTGMTVSILDNTGNVKSTYVIIIYGDVSGDGAVTINDLITIRKYIVDEFPATDDYIVRAMKTTGNLGDAVSSLSIAAGKKHILGLGAISQLPIPE